MRNTSSILPQPVASDDDGLKIHDANTVLDIEDLRVSFPRAGGTMKILKNVSFALKKGETLGLVGESGSGKSMTANTILGLLPSAASIEATRLSVCGLDVMRATPKELQALRGAKVGTILQDPTASLNPSIRVGPQVSEPLLVHRKVARADAGTKAVELLDGVGIVNADVRSRDYPHQFSGGMRQRIVGAAAIACEPDLIIADEPTTALDVTVQASYLKLLSDLQRDTEAAMLFISHDLGVVSRICDRVIVMYAGAIVESAPTQTLFDDPRHPYTMGLLSCLPSMTSRGEKLTPIPGNPPNPVEETVGCLFAARCPVAIERCHIERPVVNDVNSEHAVACFRADERLQLREVWPVVPALDSVRSSAQSSTVPVLELRDVHRSFVTKRNLLGKAVQTVEAVKGVSLHVNRGETVSIVGESGSGKTTCAKLTLGLDQPTSGEVFFDGQSLNNLTRAQTKDFRRKVQAVFQDPFTSLNPRRTILQAVIEPLQELEERISRVDFADRAAEVLQQVGLEPNRVLSSYPHQLSGGQRQRVAIARSMVTQPDCLVLDEPVSALDVSIRIQVLNILREVQEKSGVGILAISHDLGSVKYMSDRVVVMYRGEVVEAGRAAEIFSAPNHEYTRQLLKDAMVLS